MKKAFALILAIVMCIIATAMPVLAAEPNWGISSQGIFIDFNKGVEFGDSGINNSDRVTITPNGVNYNGYFGTPNAGFSKDVTVGENGVTVIDKGLGITDSDVVKLSPSGVEYTGYFGTPDAGVTKNVNVNLPILGTDGKAVWADTVNSLTSAALTPCSSSILLDGKPVSINAYTLIDVNGGSTNFVMLRDVALLLNGSPAQFEVNWSKDAGITLTSGKAYTSVGGELTSKSGSTTIGVANTCSITINGAGVSPIAYNIGGNNYFKLRDLGNALGFNVAWNSAMGTMMLNSNEPYSGK